MCTIASFMATPGEGSMLPPGHAWFECRYWHDGRDQTEEIFHNTQRLTYSHLRTTFSILRQAKRAQALQVVLHVHLLKHLMELKRTYEISSLHSLTSTCTDHGLLI
ncbi:hypothetical protein EMIT0194P_180083 [Pseudomonas serbica]